MSRLILQNLVAIHVGGYLTKTKSLLLLSALIAPVPYIIESLTNWVVSNSDYVLFVFGAIIIDHFLGTIIHLFMKRDFSFKKNIIGLIIKVGLVISQIKIKSLQRK